MQINKVKSGYIPALDGVRGLAILLVMSTHFFYKVPFFYFGWMGVDLFFVLSGYLLCSKFIKYQISKKLILTFYRNRFLRTIPIYFLLIVIFIVAYFLLPFDKRSLLYFPLNKLFISSHFFLLQNWFYIFISPLYTPIGHLWSVSVEEQFYIFFPFLILFIDKIKSKIIFILLVMLFILIIRSIDLNYNGIIDASKGVLNFQKFSFNTFYRMDSFLSGIMLAYLLNKNQVFTEKIFVVIMGVTFLLLIFFFYNNKIFNNANPWICSFGYTIIALFFTSLIYFVIQKKYLLLNIFFSSKLLVFTGKISYGLYVYHYVLDFYSVSILNFLTKRFPSIANFSFFSLLFSFLLIALSYIISYLSYIFFEKKFLLFKKPYSTSLLKSQNISE